MTFPKDLPASSRSQTGGQGLLKNDTTKRVKPTVLLQCAACSLLSWLSLHILTSLCQKYKGFGQSCRCAPWPWCGLSLLALLRSPEVSADKPEVSADLSGTPQEVGDGFPTEEFLQQLHLDFSQELHVGFESGLSGLQPWLKALHVRLSCKIPAEVCQGIRTWIIYEFNKNNLRWAWNSACTHMTAIYYI